MFSSPVWVTVLVVVIVKLLVTVVNMGAGVPCGAFIPMLAVGAGLGALMSYVCAAMGMQAAYADALVIICMAAFFTAVVRAPVTGVVMTLELTWNFAFLLPVLIGAAAGYLMGELFRTRPVYERLLDEMLAESAEEYKVRAFAARFRVKAGSVAAGRALRDVLFPQDARVTRVERGEEHFIPDGNTVLLPGDILTVEGEERAGGETAGALAETVGEETD